MPLQDLTPQLRTRLTKMERSVGWFVFLATALLLCGFCYYLYNTAQQKGWFLEKAKFHTYLGSATGLNIGDPVFLMGFQVGEVTGIAAMPPRTQHNVRVDFVIDQVNVAGNLRVPYFSYVWNQGSVVKLNSAGFLGKRGLEITRGTNGFNVYVTRPVISLSWKETQGLTDATNWRLAECLFDANSNQVLRAYLPLVQTNLERMAELRPETILAFHIKGTSPRHISSVWNNSLQRYQKYDDRKDAPDNSYELPALESPDVADQIEAMVSQVQQALPNVLALTNRLAAVLDNAANATSNLNAAIAAARPLVANFAGISGDLRGPGALGTWVLGTNATFQLEGALTNANVLLTSVDTNLDALSQQIGASLINLAGITSNLNVQVQANSNLLWGISKTVQDSDSFIQGLKHFWLLRSTFKHQYSNSPPYKARPPTKAK